MQDGEEEKIAEELSKIFQDIDQILLTIQKMDPAVDGRGKDDPPPD